MASAVIFQNRIRPGVFPSTAWEMCLVISKTKKTGRESWGPHPFSSRCSCIHDQRGDFGAAQWQDRTSHTKKGTKGPESILDSHKGVIYRTLSSENASRFVNNGRRSNNVRRLKMYQSTAVLVVAEAYVLRSPHLRQFMNLIWLDWLRRGWFIL